MKQQSVLKLFKGYIGEKTGKIRQEALQYGLLIPESASDEVYAEAIALYGKDAKKWNETFHKSWNKVASAPIEQLVYEQIIHYLTTYGFEELGIFSHDSVYLPQERLEIPELDEDIELISIHPYTEEEVSEKLMTLLTSGIALSKDTISCLTDLAELIDINRFEEIKNREARIALCDAFAIVPEDPDEFLRYIIYKATGNALKIQDKETIGHLKLYSRKELLELFQRYLRENEGDATKRLASIFYRNKKLFLAMKTSAEDRKSPASILLHQFRNRPEETEEIRQLNHLINRIRKLANEYHRPLPINKLDRLTSPSTQINDEELEQALSSITVFREIRILNGLSYALSGNPSIVYKIRNGRSYATERKTLDQDAYELIRKRHELVQKHLIGRLKETLAGKTVRLSKGFTYKAPTSEKQFVGNFPCASSYEVKRDSNVLFGIHWTNLERELPDASSDDNQNRVDLDLHTQNLEVSFGWNSAYRSDDADVYYSGDMTDAPLPRGATELFYVGQNVDSTFMLTINKYTFNPEKIPYEVILAKTKTRITPKQLNENYLVDPNEIVLTVPMEMAATESMMRLGFVYIFGDTIKVVFDSFSSSRLNVSRNDDPVFANTFKYLTASQESSLSLTELLKECGAVIIESPLEENETELPETDYDLRLNHLTKETIIRLFDKN